ncbi:MAG: DUF4198 domain-containing protein [Bryobacterales bacterium]|nr:DUF4198 domain-containing protein [Bryobacterales bacterium]
MTRRLFLASLSAGIGQAHDLYLMPQEFRSKAPGRRLIWFHLGDDFPASSSAVSVERLRNARAIGPEGTFPIDRFQAAGDRVAGQVDLPAEGTYVLAVETVPNQIDLPASSFESYLEHEGLRHVIEWRKEHGQSDKNGTERYTKFVKSVIAAGKPDGSHSRLVSFPIEIVPAADPFALRAGDALPIQVLFNGEPAADLQIQAAWARGKSSDARITGRTDAQGRLDVPIDKKGTWRLHTVLMRRRAEDDADWESFWASLTFEI